MSTTDLFANYVEAPTGISNRLWYVGRGIVFFGLCSIILGGLVRPETTLTAFWGLIVPVLPAVWLLAPGLWRNTCPLATANQLPRVLNFSRANTTPALFQRFSYTVAAGSFVGLVLTRKVVFNDTGWALSALLAAVVSLAFLGGVAFKGKSGWCSSICPLLPIQRLYGQAPVRRVANAHCQPCVGCTKNCFDFNPGVAYLADMHEPDIEFAGQRRLFAGAFPGLVVAFFTIGTADDIGAWTMYSQSLIWILGGVALFHAARVYVGGTNRLPPLFGAAGFVLFYWYSLPRMAAALTDLFGGSWSWLTWPGRFAAAAAAIAFVRRSMRSEEAFLRETSVELTTKAAIPESAVAGSEGPAGVKFVGQSETIEAPGNPSLLEVAEGAGLPIESGCRMGVCGADPVAVISGSGALTPALPAEIKTLARLGLGAPNRLACMARVTGECTVSLEPDRDSRPEAHEATFDADPAVKRLVIVGNGVAGVTAADHFRRSHPDAAIDLIGLESRPLYNRMSISKLIFRPQGAASLSLLDADWATRTEVTEWLNTRVKRIDRESSKVELATGEVLPYDRLILATGSSSRVPPIVGYDMPGAFSVRSALDAEAIRSYVQETSATTAFVAGGGLLGLEAAFSLHLLGLSVTIGERSPRLLRRQVDERGSQILTSFYESEGLTVRTEVEVAAVGGEDRVQHVILADGEQVEADVLVVAAGVVPNVALAKDAGLDVNNGVLVDDELRSSDPHIFAVGDAAEHDGRLWGLWAVATAQGEIAGRNAAGDTSCYSGGIPPTLLKGAGIDMSSFGIIEPEDGDEVVTERDDSSHYARVVRRGGRIAGGVFINMAEEAVAAQSEFEAATEEIPANA